MGKLRLRYIKEPSAASPELKPSSPKDSWYDPRELQGIRQTMGVEGTVFPRAQWEKALKQIKGGKKQSPSFQNSWVAMKMFTFGCEFSSPL